MERSTPRLQLRIAEAGALMLGIALGAAAGLSTEPVKHMSKIAAAVRTAASGSTASLASAAAVDRNSVAAAYGALPIRFEPNVGQAPAAVKFLARDAGYRIALTDDAALLALRTADTAERAQARSGRAANDETVLRLSLAHAGPSQPVAERRQGSVSNYFIGKDPAHWHRAVANYGAVRYPAIYPGIDWLVYGNPRQLEYDFVVAPHADPRRIALNWQGADRVAVDRNGDLLLQVRGQTLRQLKPVIYQSTADGARQPIAGAYVIAHNEVRFALGDYDHERALVIDPSFAYSTYLGGSGGDTALAIAVDSDGAACVAGETGSTDFPMAGAVQGSNHAAAAGSINAFVAKFNAAGSALVYSTYLGGSTDINSANAGTSGGDLATGVAVDAAGNAHVAGFTTSSDFPTVNAVQASTASLYGTGFVAELSAAGSALLFSSYLGGTGSDQANAIAVDGSSNFYVAGVTDSPDFPTVQPYQAAGPASGKAMAFISKFAAGGSALAYSTYLGGSNSGQANGIAVTAAGDAYIAGLTEADDFPVANALQATNRAGSGRTNAFVAHFDPTGASLLYSTYLGGSGTLGDFGNAIAVDNQGNAYIAGETTSSDFPTVAAFQSSLHTQPGYANAFVSKIINTPDSPASLTATAGQATAKLSWSAVTGASGYNVYQGTKAGDEAPTPVIAATTGTSATIPGLANGTRYYFEVSAINGIGEGQRSAEVSAVPQAASSGGGGAMGLDVVIGLAAAAAARRRRQRSAQAA